MLDSLLVGSARGALLRSSSALVLLAAAGGAMVGGPALAGCATIGNTTTCTTASPNPWTSTVGTGPLNHNRTVVLQPNAGISVVNRNAISLGDDANITMEANSSVRANQTSGSGLFGTGNNLVEFNSNGRLVIGAGASILKTGPQNNAEPINVHGFGNYIENHGLVQAEQGAAIWFEDWTTGAKNVVDNYGVIRRVGGGPVMGTNAGAGIEFHNRTGATVDGNLSFANGDDDLFFYANSTVTGSINGGGGTNNLTLQGSLGTRDELRGDIANFATLTKEGLGRWDATGTLSGFRTVTVRQGVLGLFGNNNNFTGTMRVDPLGTLEARAQSLPEAANPINNIGNVTNNGLVRFVQPDDGTYLGQIIGSGRVQKTGDGVLTLAPSAAAGNTYSGGTFIDDGTISIAANSALGAASGLLSIDGGTLRTTATFATTRATVIQDEGGTFEQTGATTLTHAGGIAGAGELTKAGTGTLVLGVANSYEGGTAIDAGVLQIAADDRLGLAGTGLTFGGGTLRTTTSFATARDATLEAGGGTFETAAGTTLGLSGDISGPGALGKAGVGTLVLTGDASHGGGTTISAGTLRVGAGGAAGSLAGNVTNNAALVFDRADQIDFGGVISGTGSVTQAGDGVTRLNANNSYSGPTNVAGGALYVNGNQTGTGATTASAGATFGGSGGIGGDLTIADGATLDPGDIDTGPGTLSVGGSVFLNSGSILNYDFGQANVAGGPFNDLTVVGGNLTLDGTLNVSTTPGGRFDPGVYRVFTYGGALTDNGLSIGTIPSPDFYVQTSIPSQVNLVNTTGLTLNWWDGNGPKDNGVPNGGDGVWQSSAGNDNWTEATGVVNAPFADGAFAIFPTLPGTVDVDDSLGQVSVSGMQFLVDGYLIQGDAIELVGAPGSVIRVGDGSSASADVTATIASALTGASELVKTDLGTLVLGGSNSYAGGTAVEGGVLQVDRDASLGAAAGGLRLDDGTLRTTASFAADRATTLGLRGGTFETLGGTTLTLDGAIGGDGKLTKTGDGVLVLDGANSYAGGTAINGGVVEVSANNRLGALGGPLSLDGGTLRASDGFATVRATTLASGGGTFETVAGTLRMRGDITGGGALTKTGAGTLAIAGDASHSGGTTIAEGTLAIGEGGATGTLAGDVTNDGTLAFDRSNALDFGGVISGSGAVVQRGDGVTRLTGDNSYSGSTTVTAGGLYVNGANGGAGATTAQTGATFGGAGSIAGDLTIANGATLDPGDGGSAPGTLSVGGNVFLNAGSILNYEFGQSNVPGGPLNDLTAVAGDLRLDGTINVVTSPGGTFSPGIYRVFTYGGALTDNGLAIGTIPSPDFYVQTSIPSQVNLVNTAGLELNWWDGDAGPKNNGVPNGGDGTWQSSAGNDNWTEASGAVNAPFADGSFAIFPTLPGTVNVDDSLGAISVSGMQFLVDGYLIQGDAIELVGAPGSIIRVGDGSSESATMTATIASALTGDSALVKTDLGTLVLTAANTHTGGTAVEGGVLEVSRDANLGAAAGGLRLDDGTLRTTASFATARTVAVEDLGGTLETASGTSLTLAGATAGDGNLTKTGDGTLVVTGAAAHTGGTTVSEGILSIGAGGLNGTIAGDIRNDAALVFNRRNRLDLAGVISGTGTVTQAGSGATRLSGASTYSGETLVQSGALYVNGDQRGARGLTSVASGARLGGVGVIGGDVAFGTGAILEPGDIGSAPGTLTIRGDAAFDPAAAMNYAFGRSNVPGGAFNDLTRVGGDLLLDGTINVVTAPGGTFDPGVYRVFTYGGALTDDGLEIGTIPSPDFFVQTSIPSQVNLVNTAGLTLNWWDGAAGPKNNGVPNGGDGTWQSSAGNEFWTDATGLVNAPFSDGAFAVFPTLPGTVAVDDSLGQVSVSGMQFLVDGYRIQGETIELVGDPETVIRVGDGSSESAAMTATIDAALVGDSELVKTDLGTLVLNGVNTYTGGTAIEGGVLQVAQEESLGAADGALRLDDGTLRTTASFAAARDVSVEGLGGTFETAAGTTLGLSADIGGDGSLTKTGAGVLSLTGASDYAGGTTIAAGVLSLGAGGATGSIAGDVANAGTLVFNRSNRLDLAGAISGAGAVRQVGSGVTVLSGANSYTGATSVEAGALQAGVAGAFSAGSVHTVLAGATLDLADFDQSIAGLRNAGRVTLGHVAGTRLDVTNGYAGAGGVVHFSTELGDDASETDLLAVGGATSGASFVEVSNVGGKGAKTVEGIRIIDVAGVSNGDFTLIGDYSFHGQPAIVAGAYSYTLEKNGLSTPTDSDWYLRSTLTRPEPPTPPNPPAPPRVQPGVPVYQAYAKTLLSLAGLPTMQERIGNRYWSGMGAPAGLAPADGVATRDLGTGYLEQKGAWAGIEGSWSHLEPGVSTGRDDWDIDTWKLQMGLDRPLREADDSVLIGGLTFHYGQADTDVTSYFGDGRIDSNGYGLGGALTWFREDGVYVDGQAQLTWFRSDLKSNTVGRDLEEGNDGFGYAFGVEAGKRIAVNDDWTVTPQAQLYYASVDFDDFRDTFGARVSAGDGETMPLRLGITADQEKAWLDKDRQTVRTHLYGIANVVYDFMDDTSVTVEGETFRADYEQFWGTLGVGGTYSWNDGRMAIYGEGQVATSLSDFADNYANSLTFGFRALW